MRRALVLLMVPMMAFAISWQADIDVTDGTSTRTISWGVSPLATDGYDFGIDENFPILPPSGLYAFFPFSDSTNPYITMLSRDIRKDTLAEHIWKFTGGGVFDTLTAQWNPLYLPVGDIFVGVSSSLDEPPAEMIDMTSVDQIRFYPYNYVWIDFDYDYSAPENPFSLDLFGMCNILLYVIGKGFHIYYAIMHDALQYGDLKDRITVDDFSLLDPSRLLNLKKLYP